MKEMKLDKERMGEAMLTPVEDNESWSIYLTGFGGAIIGARVINCELHSMAPYIQALHAANGMLK